jgi:photosystem II stability/assembly factor-like uncharacterized protein
MPPGSRADFGVAPEGKHPSGGHGATDSDAGDGGSAEEASATVQPPPTGWLALVGGRGVFGQTFDETTWTTRSVAREDLYAVTCATELSGWVAGANGYVAHTFDSGASFSVETTPFTATLRAIQFSNQELGVVAGDGGALALTKDGGAHWVAQDTGTSHALRGVTMSPVAHLILAVGDAGTLVESRDSGATWLVSSLPGAGNLRAVAADEAASVILAVDDEGHVFSTHEGPSAFERVATAPTALDAVALGPDAALAVAVGSNGTALAAREGGSWDALSTGTSADLHAALIVSRGERIYLGGDRGTLITSLDRGAHFSRVPLSTSAAIYALDDF